MKKFSAAAAFAMAMPVMVLACGGEGVPTTEELAKAEENMANASSGIARISAFKKLLSTKDPDLLTEAIRIGLNSNDKGIQAAALRCKLLKASQFTVQTLPFEEAANRMPDMGEKVANAVQAGQEWRFSGTAAFEGKSCVSLGKPKDCDPKYSIVASGKSVSLRSDYAIGRFELIEGGRIVGQFTASTWNKTPTVPAEIFMD